MRHFDLDDSTSDRLLSGDVSPQDAPPGLERVAERTRIVGAPGSSAATEREAMVVGALVAAVQRDGQFHHARTTKMLG